jgi:formate/nitrite transporter FocA (FNT family)
MGAMGAGNRGGMDGRAPTIARPPWRREEEEPEEGRQPGETDEEPKPLGQEAPEIVEDAAKIGGKRLDRSLAGDVMTSIIGGMSICFGVVAMAWASASFGGADGPSVAHFVGALAYPIGFVILLIGKSELFTENFLLPVTGVIERRGSVRQLGGLWAVTLIGNFLGSLVFAFLISRPGVLDPGPAGDIVQAAQQVVDYPFWTAFVKAIFAGWLMTILTWLLLAADGLGPKLVLIWLIGTLIILSEATHVIISGAEVLMASLLGSDVAVLDWLGGTFAPILLGNLIGGVVFVTLLQYVQAQYASRPD